MTGHAEGLITINIAEADDAERERRRQDMAEPYRTLLGHFRHEVGHYYWDRLVRGGAWPSRSASCSATSAQDYGASLAAHHAGRPAARTGRSASSAPMPAPTRGRTGPRPGRTTCTSSTRWRPPHAFGLRVRPQAGARSRARHGDRFRPLWPGRLRRADRAWLPLTYAVNSLNHSMGQPDLYPFVLAPTVMDKLRFVHDLIGRDGSGQATA